MAVKEIMVAAGLKNRNAADLLLFKMRHVGAVERVKRGLYCVPGQFKTDRQKERLPTQVSAKTQQTSNLSDLSDPSGPPRTAGPQSACTIE
jgi:predicted transcriptional regulator of viral defense system